MRRGVQEVANFARRMVHTLSLPKNASKPGWREMELGELENKLEEEYSELMLDIASLRIALYGSTKLKEGAMLELRRKVGNEAVDLANVCMMLTDITGGLDEQ